MSRADSRIQTWALGVQGVTGLEEKGKGALPERTLPEERLELRQSALGKAPSSAKAYGQEEGGESLRCLTSAVFPANSSRGPVRLGGSGRERRGAKPGERREGRATSGGKVRKLVTDNVCPGDRRSGKQRRGNAREMGAMLCVAKLST